ncbi:MAG: GntR family transcriptional regulator [Sphingobacteriales bacterium]
MKQNTLLEYINVNGYSSTPKYLQLANSIIKSVEVGTAKRNAVLPSINEISFQFNIGRDTVEKGYRHLKNMGVIASIPGKGYYIIRSEFKQKIKVFVLFNKLSANKKIIYDSLVSVLGIDVKIDLYIYNNDWYLFKKLLLNQRDNYTHYVIMPHFFCMEERNYEIIDTIPKEKLLLLDKLIPGLAGDYGAVYENFEKDIYHALKQAVNELRKYENLKLIFPSKGYFPKEIIYGFQKFCQHYGFSYDVVNEMKNNLLQKGDVYIILMEDDLVKLLEELTTTKLQAGSDIGVISYNETPIKKILLNGITTISTDFQYMGKVAANMILNQSNSKIEAPFYYNKRASL